MSEKKELSITQASVGTGLAQITGGTGVAKPDYLAGQVATGTELLKQYIVPPRLKVVQPTSKPPLIDVFKPGDLVAVPQTVKIDEKNGPGIVFTPLFFWPEWLCTNPREIPSLPYIRERTFDGKSQIAAKSRNAATREELCPDDPSKKYNINYVEVLNFMVLIHSDTALGLEPVLLSFQKSEHKAGTTFNSLVRLRNAPLFSCQFVAKVAERSNNKGRWFGVDIVNPPEGVSPWVKDQETFNAYGAFHYQFKQYFEDNLLLADYEEPAEPAVEVRDDM